MSNGSNDPLFDLPRLEKSLKPSTPPRPAEFYVAGRPFTHEGLLHLTSMRDLIEVFTAEHRGAFTTDYTYLMEGLRIAGVPVPRNPHLNMLFPWTQGNTQANGSPGRHDVLHGLIAPYFSKKAVAASLPTIQEYALQGLKKGAADNSGSFDLVEFSRVLSSRTVTTLMGLPPTISPIVRSEVEAYEQRPGLEFLDPEAPELREFLQKLFDQAPESGLLPELARAHLAGDITLDERDALVWGIWAAGMGSTATAISLAVGLSVEFNLLERVSSAGGEWIDGLINETLRYTTPFPLVPGTMAENLTLKSGVELKKGDFVRLALCAANRDTATFGNNADQFVPERPTAGKHLSFGRGLHWCLGEGLARLEMRVALQVLATHLKGVGLKAWHRTPGLLDHVVTAKLSYQQVEVVR